MIIEHGRLAWQVAADRGRRWLAETTMDCDKSLIGPRLVRKRLITDAAVAVGVLEIMLGLRRPVAGGRSRNDLRHVDSNLR
jgi:hypothetical protein